MCGRYALTSTADVLTALFGLSDCPPLQPRYNIAPTQLAPVVRADAEGARSLKPLYWGLVPSWAKDPSMGTRMINARSETAGEKPAFRKALAERRCLVPIDGFYEWQRVAGAKPASGGKQPCYIHAKDGRPLALAGLWERWRDRAAPDAEPVESFTILTCAPNAEVSVLHDRMPVVIPPASFKDWLDPARRTADAIAPMLRTLADGVLESWPVSRRVNRPAFDEPACLERVPEASDADGTLWG